jgi:hypothetical protein
MLKIGTNGSQVTNGYDQLLELNVNFCVVDTELSKKIAEIWQIGIRNEELAVEILTGLANKLVEILEDEDISNRIENLSKPRIS